MKESESFHSSEPNLQKMGADAVRGNWGRERHVLAKMFESLQYQALLGVVVLFQAVLVISEVDTRAAGAETPGWSIVLDYVWMVVYFVEICIRLYVYRRSFFDDLWNRVDFTVVMLDIIDLLAGSKLPSLTILRLCRCARLVRLVRFLRIFGELDTMLRGFMSAMRAMFWASIMLAVIMTFFSIMAVELLHPVVGRVTEKGVFDDCERCQRAFGSVMDANLTFLQQIVAGDSWGQVSIPIIEEEPLAALFINLVLGIVEFCVLNLVLGAIVDNANSAREADEAQSCAAKAAERELLGKKLLKLCAELDEDGSGNLTVDEFMAGMNGNVKFAQLMSQMDIDKEEIDSVFLLLDQNRSGSVRYREFVTEVVKMKTQSESNKLTDMRCQLSEMQFKLAEELGVVRQNLESSTSDAAGFMNKVLFGGPVQAHPLPGKPQPATTQSESSRTDACGCQGFVSEGRPDGAACPSRGAATNGSPGTCLGEGAPFLGGLLRLEEILLQLDKQANEQLVLLQDFGSHAWPAALDAEPEELCEGSGDEAQVQDEVVLCTEDPRAEVAQRVQAEQPGGVTAQRVEAEVGWESWVWNPSPAAPNLGTSPRR